jgi:hypothetical protein
MTRGGPVIRVVTPGMGLSRGPPSVRAIDWSLQKCRGRNRIRFRSFPALFSSLLCGQINHQLGEETAAWLKLYLVNRLLSTCFRARNEYKQPCIHA